MFGFIRPVKPELRVREVDRFQAVYCGLCHEIKRRYGRMQTWFLSYDMTFLALVLGAVTPDDPGTETCRCDASPLRKKCVCRSSDVLTYTADVSVLLVYHKTRDTIADETGVKRLAARALLRLMRPAYRRASAAQPALDETMRTCLDELSALEQARTPSLDRPADTFARLLAAAVPSCEANTARILRQMFYHTGRWLYLLDACADLAEDLASGAYNPIALRFGLTKPGLEPVKEQLEHTLERSLLDIHTACQLLTLYRDQGLLENMIDLGLPLVTRQVLDGTYQSNGGHDQHGSL